MLKQLGAQQLSAKVRGQLGNDKDLAASQSHMLVAYETYEYVQFEHIQISR